MPVFSLQDGEDAGDPLDPAPGSKWQQFFQDKEVAEQIQRDVERTHSSEPFFGSDNAQAKGHREVRQLDCSPCCAFDSGKHAVTHQAGVSCQ